MTPFRSLRDYEHFVYTLPQRFPRILRSTLVIAQRGPQFAELTGEVTFAQGYRLSVYERVSWDVKALTIQGYSYEVWQGNDKVYWYDSQSHPNDATLASTDPHHKHIPPNIKHHRVPAPGLSLDAPNLSFLITEIEAVLLGEMG
jgi:hypothetical protein